MKSLRRVGGHHTAPAASNPCGLETTGMIRSRRVVRSAPWTRHVPTSQPEGHPKGASFRPCFSRMACEVDCVDPSKKMHVPSPRQKGTGYPPGWAVSFLKFFAKSRGHTLGVGPTHVRLHVPHSEQVVFFRCVKCFIMEGLDRSEHAIVQLYYSA